MKGAVQIRRGTQDDIGVIQKLNCELFKMHVTKKYDETINADWALGAAGREHIARAVVGGFVMVAEADGGIMGYMVGTFGNKIEYSSEVYAEIDGMYIEKRWRHHQIGSLFFHEFLKNCKARGVSAIRVLASAKNKDAISFYKKHGFRDFDVIMRRKC